MSAITPQQEQVAVQIWNQTEPSLQTNDQWAAICQFVQQAPQHEINQMLALAVHEQRQQMGLLTQQVGELQNGMVSMGKMMQQNNREMLQAIQANNQQMMSAMNQQAMSLAARQQPILPAQQWQQLQQPIVNRTVINKTYVNDGNGFSEAVFGLWCFCAIAILAVIPFTALLGSNNQQPIIIQQEEPAR